MEKTVTDNQQTNNSDALAIKKYVCKKCSKESENLVKYCPYCGSPEIEEVEKLLQRVAPLVSAATGTPINKGEYATYLFNPDEKIILKSLVKEELEKTPNYSKLTLQSIERKKTIMVLIYSLIAAIAITLHVAYHFELIIMIGIFLIMLITYIINIKRYGLENHLRKEVKSRPDEKVSYIVNSVLSGATNNKEVNNILRSLVLIITLAAMIIIYSSPHMIYEKVDGGYNLRYYTYGILKQDKSLSIPATYKGENVIGIRGDVFKNVRSLEVVKLPESIKEIRGGAFQNCYHLKSINLPSGITEIHGSTFEGCSSLESIVIPEGVTRIGGSAFRECHSLKEATIPKTVKEIGSSAFRRTQLTNVCISSSTYVNGRAFKETNVRISYYENNCIPREYTYNWGDYYYE